MAYVFVFLYGTAPRYLICCTAFQTSHRDAVSGHQPPLNWSSLCHSL